MLSSGRGSAPWRKGGRPHDEEGAGRGRTARGVRSLSRRVWDSLFRRRLEDGSARSGYENGDPRGWRNVAHVADGDVCWDFRR